MNRNNDTDKSSIVLAMLIADYHKHIKWLLTTLVLALIVCGISVIVMLYTVAGKGVSKSNTEVVGVSAVASAYIGKAIKTETRKASRIRMG